MGDTVPGVNQLDYPRDLDDMAAWVASHGSPGCRVLEVGCGDGALTERLAADGFDVLGIDPNGPDGPRFVRSTIEEYESDLSFDVIVSSVAMHHVGDLAAAAQRVAATLAPGGAVLLREFDRDVIEGHEPTQRWWHHQLLARQAIGELDDVDPDFAGFGNWWKAKIEHHVIHWPRLRSALNDVGVSTIDETPGAYLFRYKLTESLRPLEDDLIAAGRIRPIGVRWVGRRD